MKIWSPLHILLARFGTASFAGPVSRRWRAAARENPELVEDVIRLGGVLATSEVELRDGIASRVPADPNDELVEKGRRDLALELLALMQVDPTDLRKMMEMEYEDHDPSHDDD